MSAGLTGRVVQQGIHIHKPEPAFTEERAPSVSVERQVRPDTIIRQTIPGHCDWLPLSGYTLSLPVIGSHS
eukprot:3287174-Pyramimonas_sp.AAC.1